MAPTPLRCSVDECPFATPNNCPDWEKMLKILELHTAAAHGVVTNAAPGNNPSTPRLEKLPRPTFTLDMSQSEWSLTEAQLSAYISEQVQLREEVRVQQLQGAYNHKN